MGRVLEWLRVELVVRMIRTRVVALRLSWVWLCERTRSIRVGW